MHCITRMKKPIQDTYMLKGEALRVAPYLGLTISKDLRWHNQVSKVTATANRALGFINRILSHLHNQSKKKAYTVIVRPTLDYAATVWDPHQQYLKKDVERVQQRADRYVSRNYDPIASVTRCKRTWDHVGWESLSNRDTTIELSYHQKKHK